MRGGIWNYLPGTEKEVNSIEKIMQTSGMQTNLKKGYEATEESFKNIGTNNSPSPRILHIATHGYFFLMQKIKINILQTQNQYLKFLIIPCYEVALSWQVAMPPGKASKLWKAEKMVY
ncbi:MAG: CHAT domain-containing protein [Saprospiraceae bacterium]|nr:CHAT domain-containing protein [Candidatus Vicinibacter affinis]